MPKYFNANYFRQSVARLLKEIDPRGSNARKKDLNRRRAEYIVPGPDWLWSLDGHDKLAEWGFQIYAAIDAYSRKIMWVYCGISNRTSRSILQQYLESVRDLGYFPKILRSDHGTECPLAAEAHYAFHRETWADEQTQLKFGNVYFFGGSTHNQRIESWWGQLEKSKLYWWRVYMSRLYLRIILIEHLGLLYGLTKRATVC